MSEQTPTVSLQEWSVIGGQCVVVVGALLDLLPILAFGVLIIATALLFMIDR